MSLGISLCLQVFWCRLRHQATVIALGPEPLVTLSMSKKVFDESGLKSQLHFPKRPAIEMAFGGSSKAFHHLFIIFSSLFIS